MNEVWQSIIFPVLSTALIGLAGWVGTQLAAVWKKVAQDKTKEQVARTVVRAVEQMYKDIHGDDKKKKAAEGIAEMLDQKGIPATPLEIDMLIESAVAEFNDAFNQPREIAEESETE